MTTSNIIRQRSNMTEEHHTICLQRQPDGICDKDRRQFTTLIGGAAIAALSGLSGRAQPGQMRRIGTLIGGVTYNDPEIQRRLAALKEGLQALGWIEAQNFRFEHRSAGDPSAPGGRRRRWPTAHRT